MTPGLDLRGRLSVSIVTYNNAAYLPEVLPGCIQALRATGVEAYFIDNGSTDATPDLVEAALAGGDGRIRLLRSGANLGFGGGHNLVLDRLGSRYHLFCNPDILLASAEPLVRCAAFLEAHPEVGMATIRLRNRDGSVQHVNHLAPTVLDLALRRLCRRERVPAWVRRRMDRYEMRDREDEEVLDVPFVSGAFMMVRTDLLKALGGFDPRFFLYFEDADLCRRVLARGARAVRYAGAETVHFWQRDGHKRLRVGLIMVMSMLRYFSKWGWTWY